MFRTPEETEFKKKGSHTNDVNDFQLRLSAISGGNLLAKCYMFLLSDSLGKEPAQDVNRCTCNTITHLKTMEIELNA